MFVVYVFLHNDFILSKKSYFISQNIKESKARRAFIEEFEIKNIGVSNQHPIIKNAWIEYPWHWERSMYIFKKSVVDSLSNKLIIFDLIESNTDFLLNNYLQNWIIKDSQGNSAGLHNGQIVIPNNLNSKIYIIYKTRKEFEFYDDNLTPILEFEIISKQL